MDIRALLMDSQSAEEPCLHIKRVRSGKTNYLIHFEMNGIHLTIKKIKRIRKKSKKQLRPERRKGRYSSEKHTTNNLFNEMFAQVTKIELLQFQDVGVQAHFDIYEDAAIQTEPGPVRKDNQIQTTTAAVRNSSCQTYPDHTRNRSTSTERVTYKDNGIQTKPGQNCKDIEMQTTTTTLCSQKCQTVAITRDMTTAIDQELLALTSSSVFQSVFTQTTVPGKKSRRVQTEPNVMHTSTQDCDLCMINPNQYQEQYDHQVYSPCEGKLPIDVALNVLNEASTKIMKSNVMLIGNLSVLENVSALLHQHGEKCETTTKTLIKKIDEIEKQTKNNEFIIKESPAALLNVVTNPVSFESVATQTDEAPFNIKFDEFIIKEPPVTPSNVVTNPVSFESVATQTDEALSNKKFEDKSTATDNPTRFAGLKKKLGLN